MSTSPGKQLALATPTTRAEVCSVLHAVLADPGATPQAPEWVCLGHVTRFAFGACEEVSLLRASIASLSPSTLPFVLKGVTALPGAHADPARVRRLAELFAETHGEAALPHLEGALVAACANEPDAAIEYLRDGREALDGGDLRRAHVRLSLARLLAPAAPAVNEALGDVLRRLGQWDASGARYSEALAACPEAKAAEILRKRAAAHSGANRPHDARADLGASLARQDYWATRYDRAAISFKLGEYRHCVEDLVAANAAEPGNQDVVELLVAALEKLGRLDDAVGTLRAFAEGAPPYRAWAVRRVGELAGSDRAFDYPSLVEHPTGGFEQFVGDEIKRELLTLVVAPAKHPELAQRFLVRPAWMLFFGAPGSGKSFLCRCIAAALGYPLIAVSLPALASPYHSEIEQRLFGLGDFLREKGEAVLLLDEVDSLVPSSNDPSSAIAFRVGQAVLLALDRIRAIAPRTVVLATSNHREAIQAPLLRPGRIDVCVEIPPLTVLERARLLELHLAAFDPNHRLPYPALARSDLSPAALVALAHDARLMAFLRATREPEPTIEVTALEIEKARTALGRIRR